MQSGAIFGGLPSGSGPFAVSFIQSSFTSFTFVWHRTQDEIKVEKGTNACIGCSIFVYAAPNFKVSFKCCPYSHAPFTLPLRLTVANVVVVAVVVAAADFVCICVRRLYVFVCGKHLQKATHAAKLHNEAPSIPHRSSRPFRPSRPSHIVAAAPCCLTKSINTMQAQHDGATFRGHIHIHILIHIHIHIHIHVHSHIHILIQIHIHMHTCSQRVAVASEIGSQWTGMAKGDAVQQEWQDPARGSCYVPILSYVENMTPAGHKQEDESLVYRLAGT